MANTSVLAQGNTDSTPNEGNGVAGPTSPVPRTTNAAVAAGSALPLATVSGTLAGNNFSADQTTALRHSVAGTQGGTGFPKSEIYSETMCFRTPYSAVESDTGIEANGTGIART